MDPNDPNARYIAELVAAAPPLTEIQMSQLTGLLRGYMREDAQEKLRRAKQDNRRRALESAQRIYLYRYYGDGNALLYIGITGYLGQREAAHRSRSEWYPLVVRRELEEFPNRGNAERAEKLAIQTERPKFNKQHSVAT